MQRAMEETERRREKQTLYNQEHGIKPIGIQKNVADIMEGSRVVPGRKKKKQSRVAEPKGKYAVDLSGEMKTAGEINKKLDGLNKKCTRPPEISNLKLPLTLETKWATCESSSNRCEIPH